MWPKRFNTALSTALIGSREQENVSAGAQACGPGSGQRQGSLIRVLLCLSIIIPGVTWELSMEKIARRRFCGTALLALPLLCLRAKGGENVLGQSDPILDTLADEFTRIAADGAQNGFNAEHYRRCAGIVRTFDARLEEKGINRDLNGRLDEDDFYKLNPNLAARMAADFWNRHGIRLSTADLEARLTVDPTSYREMKKRIKKLGGIRVLHAGYAEALERKARENATASSTGGAVMRNGFVAFPSSNTAREKFTTVQYDYQFDFDINDYDINALLNTNRDCLCQAMIVEGALLSLACLAGCVPCCVPGAFILALEKFFESMGICSPSRC